MDKNSAADTYLGKAVVPYCEPWYRFDRVISLLERHVSIPAGARWLDLGCQLGQFLWRVQVHHGITPTGIDDFDARDVIEVCAKYFDLKIRDVREVINDSWRYLSRRIDKTGIDIDEKFDFISALEILEHMIDTDAFLGECRNHLAPGGYLIISTPNINSLRNRVQVPLGIYPAGMEYRNKIHHVRLYNASALVSQLREHGFDLIALRGVNFLPARLLRYRPLRGIDRRLADLFPRLCGALIGIFRLRHPA